MEPEAVLVNLRRGTIEYCVLAMVRDEPRYALDLARDLADAELLTSEGTLYPLLSRLRRDGLVTTSWVESPSGPPRRYYRTTAAGTRALAGFSGHWTAFRDAVDRVLGKESA
jgi:PadR family transcriptional regulator, regulatory protein PadR